MTTIEEYFEVMDRKVLGNLTHDYTKLIAHYQKLKTHCYSLEQEIGKNVFAAVRELLAIDAKVQILLEYIQWHLYDVYSEEEIIQRVEEDSRCYYRERTGLKASDRIPAGIMYVSER